MARARSWTISLLAWIARPVHLHISEALLGPTAGNAPERQAQDRVWNEVQERVDTLAVVAMFRFVALLAWPPLWWLLPKDEGSALVRAKDLRRHLRAHGRSWRVRTPAARVELLHLLNNCDRPHLRRFSFVLRLLYVSRLYAAELAAHLSGLPERGNEEASTPPKAPVPRTHLIRRGRHLVGEVDTIVVGSGAAGAIVANQLHARGERVVVLERGPFVLPGAINTRDNLSFLESGGLRASQGAGFFFTNAAVVGGGPTINVDMAMAPHAPFIRHRIESWRAEGKIPHDLWTPQAMDEAYAWVAQRMRPRTVGPDELNENNRIVQQGARARGQSTRWFELTTHDPGTSPMEVTDKRSSVETFLLPCLADEHNPITLIPDVDVRKVLMDGARATGVRFVVRAPRDRPGIVHDPYGWDLRPGQKLELRAKRVVLSAGTFGSTCILQRSGIDNPNIGRGFVAHPFMPVVARFGTEVRPHERTSSSIFVDSYLPTAEHPDRPGYIMEPAAGPPDFAALGAPGSPADVREAIERQHQSAGMAMLLIDEPYDHNFIHIDAIGLPAVKYRLPERDVRRFARGIAEAARLYFAAGATRVSVVSFEQALGRSQAFLHMESPEDANLLEQRMQFVPYQSLIMGAHMMAANKVSTDPARGVVDPSMKVWGTDNLYVMDAGVFPGSVGANPVMTIMTVAKLFCDRAWS